MLINKSKGFTIVEMVVIAPIVILTISAIIFAIVTMTGDVLATRAANVMAYNIQDALNRIESDVKFSNGYLLNSISPISPQGQDNGTSAFSGSLSTTAGPLILEAYATNENPLSKTKKILYTDNNPYPCSNLSSSALQNQPMMLNIVYFISNNTLWRRVLTPSATEANYKGCEATSKVSVTPWQQPSCASTSSYPCKVQDVI
jgi:Tfp pilus assembly protein PilE